MSVRRTRIPVGLAGNAGALGAGQTQLYDNVASGAIASWDVSSISQAYKHLEIVVSGRTDRAATNQQVGIRFNNDTGANYDWQNVRAAAAGTAATESIADTSIVITNMTGTTATASFVGSSLVEIPDYTSSAFYKTVNALSIFQVGTSTGNITELVYGGTWRNTAAVTRVTVFPYTSGNFIAGSRLTIYGMN
jgi:hypothetical protein